MIWLAVALGGALGAMARYGVSSVLLPVDGKSFPWGTFTANVCGSLFIGLCYILLNSKPWLSELWKPVVMTGFLGAFTTYSTFALESVVLWQQGQTTIAISYALGSLVACLTAVIVSMALMAKLIH